MAMINVDRRIDDKFCRYQMPKLVAVVESTGRGIKTVLVNVSAVAKALHRPPTYITKYFGFELGAQVQMNEKDDRFIVKGAHDRERLQNLLDGFIKRFVLCLHCSNPETELIPSFRKRNGGELSQQCMACGLSSTIRMGSHKLTTFISKNSSQRNGNNGSRESDEGSPTDQGGEENGSRENGGVDDDGTEDWGDDVPSSVAQLDSHVRRMIQSEDLDKSIHERCEQFNSLLKKTKLANQLNDPASVKDLITEAKRLEIMEKAPFVVIECLFTDQIVKEIEAKKMLLQNLCTKNPKGQKYLLHGLETIIGTNHEIRERLFNKKEMSRILLKLYEEDIVEEDVFYLWHEKTSKRFVDKAIANEIREYAKEFIEWLRTAEESSDDEDDGEKLPEPQIDFTHAAGNTLEVKVEPVKKADLDETIEYNGKIIDVDNI